MHIIYKYLCVREEAVFEKKIKLRRKRRIKAREREIISIHCKCTGKYNARWGLRPAAAATACARWRLRTVPGGGRRGHGGYWLRVTLFSIMHNFTHISRYAISRDVILAQLATSFFSPRYQLPCDVILFPATSSLSPCNVTPFPCNIILFALWRPPWTPLA